ncbi:hypothetical protein ACLI1C_15395 [Devosia sp. XGJD_8]|uniref:hypothetical protein n=1 Tax=Devosia sp. XGJD_8 TaxID=3391187 RepID=UPI00398478D0
MRDVVHAAKNGQLRMVDPVEFLWELQWDRTGCQPGTPGWQLNKFQCDTVPWHRSRLVILLDIEPNGKGIRFESAEGEGRFWSTPGFLKRNGFSFDFAHEDYTLEALGSWFWPTTDGDWDKVFSKAKIR